MCRSRRNNNLLILNDECYLSVIHTYISEGYMYMYIEFSRHFLLAVFLWYNKLLDIILVACFHLPFYSLHLINN